MKSCEEYRELISAYYDYELDRTTRMEVEAHVESCAQCAEVFRQYGEICPLDKGAMPSSVVQPVMERINAYETETDPFDKQGGEGARQAAQADEQNDENLVDDRGLPAAACHIGPV